MERAAVSRDRVSNLVRIETGSSDMKTKGNRSLRVVLGLLTVLSGTLPLGVLAEQSKSFGDYTIHYNAFSSNNLQQSVAKSYGIARSANLALLNVTVLQKTGDDAIPEQPVRAQVEATASNLNGQLRTLRVRELVDGDSVYYIAEAPIRKEETLTYDIRVLPEGGDETFSFRFQQQFFGN